MGDLDIEARVKEARARKWDDRTLAQRAAELAQDLLLQGQKLLRSHERALLFALSKIVSDDKNRHFIEGICTQLLGQQDITLQATRLRQLLDDFGGIPTLFSTLARLRLKAAAMASHRIQGAAMAEVLHLLRSTFEGLTLPTQVEKLSKRVRDYSKEGISLLLNPLVPDVYGEKSAERYRKNLESILTRQEQVGIVIQPWRLCPQMTPYAPAFSSKILAEQLRKLLPTATAQGNRPIIMAAGTADILPITIEALKTVLSSSAFRQADVAMELPAYLQQSESLLRELTEWASTRSAKGSVPFKILLVKGSHWEEDRICAATFGQEESVSAHKTETETRYKKLLHTAMMASDKAIIPVTGTHNLFDLAYSLLDWGRSGRSGLPPYSLIAGLGNHTARLLSKAGASVSLVAGISAEEEQGAFERYFLSLIHELARPDGFLSASSTAEPNSMGWSRMRQHFLASLSGREERTSERKNNGFTSSALSHALNRPYIDQLYAEAATEAERIQPPLPLLVEGKEAHSPLICINRSLSAPGLEDYRFVSADYEALNRILSLAKQATANMPDSLNERRKSLLRLARLLDKKRAGLTATLIRDAGMTLEEADCELRDAIDACHFYEQSILQDGLQDGTQPAPLGVVVIAPGPAHPLANAVAHLAAAWIAGNVILYRPSSRNALTARTLEPLLTEAGFTAPRLQTILCLDNQLAEKVMTDPAVQAVIHTGTTSDQLARLAQRNPGIRHLASQMGHTVLYLSNHGDWRRAVHDLAQKAFRRAGLGATAPHILLVHADLYDNQHFMNALRDAILSLPAHAGHHEGTGIGPISAPLDPTRLHWLSQTEDEEAWLVQPHAQEIGSSIWTPGIRTGVRPTSLFARQVSDLPLLGLIRIDNLESAIAVQNELSNGLAASLYSTNEEEISTWRSRVKVGNLSINCLPEERPGLQPFGGWGASQAASTPKSGGNNYILALAQWQETARPQRRASQRNTPFSPWETLSPKPNPDDITRLGAAADSISYWWETEFGVSHYTTLPGCQITRQYAPLSLCLRVDKATSDIDLSIALMASLKAGCEIQVSTSTLRPWMPRVLEQLGVSIVVENQEELEARFPSLALAGIHVRDCGATDATQAAAAACGLHLDTDSVLANARLEMLHCMKEQVTARRTSPT